MLTFLDRPNTATFTTSDDTSFAGSDYLDEFYRVSKLVTAASGAPITRARCSSDVVCIILGRATGTTMYPGDSPGPAGVWCGADRGNLVIWEDVSLDPWTVVLE